jgi:CheY-like chemotaxis protein
MKKLDNPTVLLVDDEEEILLALGRRYRKEAFTLLTASSGEEALEILKSREVHVLLSDARMPGMGGIELLKLAKKLYPEMIRIMISGYVEPENLMAAVNTGEVFRFIAKPWEDSYFRSCIYEALDNYEALRQNREDMKKILEHPENRVRKGRREAGLFITNALMEEYDLPALCVDGELNIYSFNTAADRLFGGVLARGTDRGLSQLLGQETVDQLRDIFRGGEKKLYLPAHIAGQKLAIRIRPLRKSDTPAAILFFEGPN